jgi:hypothetical protein
MNRKSQKAMFAKGARVKFSDSALDNENYNPSYNKDRVFIVTHVATNEDEHMGYDTGVGEALYDLKDKVTGKDFDNSLYDYELERA